MRRHAALIACAVLALASPIRGPGAFPPAFADEKSDKATADYKAIEKWTEDQKPKTAEDAKTLRTELAKRLRAFLKEHPSSGRPTLVGRNSLAGVLVVDGKADEALPLYEENLKSSEDEFQQRARHGIIKALIAKKDTKAARARLDVFLKDRPDDKNLLELDDYLKKLGEAKAPPLKVGAAAPAIKGKLTDEKEFDLAAFKGKIVLIDFWATWCPPCKKEFPALKKLHAELKDKGFEIVGVDCFEKDWAAYKTFVEKEQLGWPQIAKDDAKKVSRDYGVENLPRTVIVGKNGEVLALDLRGDALAAAVRAAVEGKPIPAAKDRPEKPKDGAEKPAKPAIEPGDHPKSED